VAAVAAEQRTFRARLEALVRHFCHAYDDNPMLFAYLLLTQHQQVRKAKPEMASPVAVVHRVVAEGLAERAGERRDPDVVAAMVLGLVLQVAVERLYGRIEGNMMDQAETLAGACWRVAEGP